MKQIVTITGENLNVVLNNAEAMAAPSQKKTKAQMRIEALKAAGVDVSNYFTMGADMVVKAENGAVVPIEDDAQTLDAVGKQIVEGGYVSNWKLFRRWVMSQMFHMLRSMEVRRRSFNQELQWKGYEYQWSMLERELCAQMKMRKHGDYSNQVLREMWFNGKVAYGMAMDYIDKLKAYIENNLVYRKQDMNKPVDERRYKHTCKGVAYVRLANEDIFVSDLQKKVYTPLFRMAYKMQSAPSINTLYNTLHEFNKTRKHLHWDTKQASAFINAYKGSGSYYTMRNLIMFHGARFHVNGVAMSETQSLNRVNELAKDCINAHEEWRMLGILKELIKDSGISIQGKIDEWKK